MLFIRAFFALGLAAAAQAQSCTPGTYQCGNQGGAPGPDGSVQVCGSNGRWQFSSQCGGPTCCQKNGANVVCTCFDEPLVFTDNA